MPAETRSVAAASTGRPAGQAPAAQDPLPSWNQGAARAAIVAFVDRVTKAGGPDFVPVPERIAVFDNDGTLWSEKPVPFQLLFAFERVKALAPTHPEWQTAEPFASLLKGEMAGVIASGEKGLMRIVATTHAGMALGPVALRLAMAAADACRPTPRGCSSSSTESQFSPARKIRRIVSRPNA